MKMTEERARELAYRMVLAILSTSRFADNETADEAMKPITNVPGGPEAILSREGDAVSLEEITAWHLYMWDQTDEAFAAPEEDEAFDAP